MNFNSKKGKKMEKLRIEKPALWKKSVKLRLCVSKFTFNLKKMNQREKIMLEWFLANA